MHITAGVAQAPAHARKLAGPLLPGLVDAHSHAFQRAFAGLSERRESESDDFWSWRERMYRVALRITPQQMRAIAAQLYVELLRGGYTQVCEFHYLHHDLDGTAYADPATMGWAIADAAQDAGIGLTLLPVLYQRAGFNQPQLRDDQRRFAGSPTMVYEFCLAVQASARANVNAGVAVHSLRAAGKPAIQELMALVGDASMPIHIHVAEQTAEVDDCLQATGRRPIGYLCAELAPDARWQLVHATHVTAQEVDAVARSGAAIVICPATEGNLGDGLTDLALWLKAGVPMAIGSDSQVVRNWPEELRWLEYGQRLVHRKRNVAAMPGTASLHSGATVRSCAACRRRRQRAARLGPGARRQGRRAGARHLGTGAARHTGVASPRRAGLRLGRADPGRSHRRGPRCHARRTPSGAGHDRAQLRSRDAGDLARRLSLKPLLRGHRPC